VSQQTLQSWTWTRWTHGARTLSCICWVQDISRFKPSTVSRRFSIVARFYRTIGRRGKRRPRVEAYWDGCLFAVGA